MKISNFVNGKWYSIRCNTEDTHFLNRVLDAAIESGKLNADDKDKSETIKRHLPAPTSLSKMIDTDGVENIGYGKIFTHLNFKETTIGELYCFSNSFYEICESPETCRISVLAERGRLLSNFIDSRNVCYEFCREVGMTRLKEPTNTLEETWNA